MTQIYITINPKWWWLLIVIPATYLLSAISTVARNDWKNYSYRKPESEE